MPLVAGREHRDFDPDFDFDFDHGSWADKFNTRKLSMFAHAAAPHGEFDLGIQDRRGDRPWSR